MKMTSFLVSDWKESDIDFMFLLHTCSVRIYPQRVSLVCVCMCVCVRVCACVCVSACMQLSVHINTHAYNILCCAGVPGIVVACVIQSGSYSKPNTILVEHNFSIPVV